MSRTAKPCRHGRSPWFCRCSRWARSAWAINFDDGFTGFNAGASGAWNYFTAAYVRCVR
jgi:hypothetical protein